MRGDEGWEALKNIHPTIPKIITRDIISENVHFSTISRKLSVSNSDLGLTTQYDSNIVTSDIQGGDFFNETFSVSAVRHYPRGLGITI